MNYSIDGFKFSDVRDEILLAAADNQMGFYETTLGDLASAYDGTHVQGKEQQYTLTPTGFDNLASRIGFPKAALAQLSSDLKMRVVREKIEDKADVPIKVATSNDGIDAVFSAEYEPINNSQLSILLGTVLPEDAVVHRWAMGNDARRLDLRVVSPESWPANLGNGRPDPGFGGLHITNDELGRAALSVNLVVARVVCLNYVVSQQQVLRQEHRWFSPTEFYAALTASIGNVPDYVEEVAAEMRGWHGVPVEDPVLTFSRVQEIAGVPQYAMDDAQEYWAGEGGEHNMFALVQAVSHGLKGVSERGQPGPAWDRRNRIEAAILDIGTQAREHHAEHDTDWASECLACHQPLPENV